MWDIPGFSPSPSSSSLGSMKYASPVRPTYMCSGTSCPLTLIFTTFSRRRSSPWNFPNRT